MDYHSYFEMLSNDSPNPCYFAHMETHQLLFLNKAMRKHLKDYEEESQRPCYQVIHGNTSPCSFCPNESLEPQVIQQNTLRQGQSNHYFRCNATKLLLDKVPVNMSKYFAASAPHSLPENTPPLTAQEDLDSLTGCYNRQRYSQTLKELQKKPPNTLGILFINLNGLRKTNELLGYEVGDVQILKTLDQLRHHFPEEFYRISGDEFICFMSNIPEQEFHRRVDKLQSDLQDNNNNSYSVGSAWNEGDFDVMKLVATADTVMYINKQEYYYNNFQENPEMTESMLQDLLSALRQEEFLVYLQPKVQLSTGKVTGAEALVRRYDPVEKTMIYPNSFIPKYEKHAIIRHIDLFVLETVCQILTQWAEDFDPSRRVPISVNLSRVTLSEYGIVKIVTDICDKYQVPRNLIMLEVTERIGLMETGVASTLVEEFQAEGFKISLDDFGCAYSNIVTLAQISVDEVKLDKSLIDDLMYNPKNKIILENMIHMCNALENTTTLAEGIELIGQADSLRSIQCDYGQGYLYSKPIPHQEFFQLYIQGETAIQTKPTS